MGLLTNANSGQGPLFNMLNFVVAHAKIISWAFYILGVVFIFVMPHSEFTNKTYFSENALLPGLVRIEFDIEHIAKQYLEDLREESQKTPSTPPFPWIEARLKQMGLEVYRHNFSIKFPLGRGEVYKGNNIYAILRAPRASSTESLVFATPYRPPISIESPTDVSLAVLLTMAKFFRHQKYWAKDIIFLITEHEQLGMQAWLEAYHRTSCGYGQALDHGDLEARAGSIQAAINLEISHEKFTHLNVKVEGLNGQLPNLDLVNLVTKLALKEGLPPMFQGNEDASYPESWNGYWRSFKTFLQMAMKQAAGGVPSGNHGLFHRFGIEAVSIESVHKFTKKTRRREHDLYTMGRIMEAIFRSLNNLLERFHQSFFFYLLPSTSRYVSIGMYMPGFGLLAGSMAIQALGLWYQCVQEINPTDDTQPQIRTPNVGQVFSGWILCHIIGICMVFCPRLSSSVGAKFLDLATDDSIILGLAFFSLFFFPIMVYRSSQTDTFGQEWRLVKIFALLEVSIIAFSMSLCNFSLAYLVTLCFSPMALISGPSSRKSMWILKSLFTLLVHPMSLVFIACLVDTFRSFPENSLLEILSFWRGEGSAFFATKQAVMYSITDGYIYGNYTFAVAAVFLMPCWFLFWIVTSSRIEKLKEE